MRHVHTLKNAITDCNHVFIRGHTPLMKKRRDRWYLASWRTLLHHWSPAYISAGMLSNCRINADFPETMSLFLHSCPVDQHTSGRSTHEGLIKGAMCHIYSLKRSKMNKKCEEIKVFYVTSIKNFMTPPVSLMRPYFRKALYGSEWRETNHFTIAFESCHESHIWCLSV